MKLLLFIVFAFNSFLSFGSDTLVLTQQNSNINVPDLGKSIYYYKDTTGKLSLKEISKKPFKSTENYYSDKFNSKSNYWYKLIVNNKDQSQKLWFFEALDPHIEYIKVYEIAGKDTLAFVPTGFSTFYNTRQTNHKNFVFPVKFYESDSYTIYFSFKNNYQPSLSISLRPAKQFIDYALSEYYLLGIFYGILLIMAVYNIFIFFSTRERVYLFYVCYVLCYCLNSLTEDGLGFQFLWPSHPFINPLLQLYSPLILIISLVFYTKAFLFLDKSQKRLSTILTISLLIYCLIFFINNFIATVAFIRYVYLLPFALIFIAGVRAMRKGNRSARYFLLGMSSLVISFTVAALRIAQLVPTLIHTVYILNYGFLLDVVFFSYALAQRLRIEKEEKANIDAQLIRQLRENEKLKDSLNRELEYKVEERTKELGIALKELKEKNQYIEKLNSFLEQDNKALNQDIKDITKARLMLKDLTFDEFKKIYPDEESCFKYLADIKWSKAYVCKKCNNKNSSNGKTPFSKRCTKCGYDESVTSFTLFHNSKIPITTSFYLVYLVLAHKNISSHELSDKLGLRQKTCWAFKKKIVEAIEGSKSPKLNSKEWGYIFYN